jgi:hypothetical protein
MTSGSSSSSNITGRVSLPRAEVLDGNPSYITYVPAASLRPSGAFEVT